MAEEDELVLLERVFLRLGSADTDNELELTLGRFLTPVLLKLSSPAEGVRKKVMELLVHVNKRVKSRSKVLLPVEMLIKQFCDSTVSPFVTNFTILYIKMGFPRLPPDQQVGLLPQLLHCLHGRPDAQQASFLQLIALALPAVQPPTTVDEYKTVFWCAEEDQKIRTLLFDFLLDCLLLPYNYSSFLDQLKAGRPHTTASGTDSAGTGESSASSTTTGTCPPGLSESTLKRTCGDNPPTPEDLEKIKHAIVLLLGSGALPAETVACHLAVASADSRYSVATAAELKMKQLVGPDIWNHSSVVKKLYSLFLGTTAVKGQPIVKPELKRYPASVQLRLKLMPYLLKSSEAANQFPACVQIVFDCLYTTNTNAKLKNMAVSFVINLCQNASDVQFSVLGSVLLSGMIKLVGEAADDPKLRSYAYVAVGRIGQRAPQLVSKDVSLVQRLCDSLSKEEGDVKSAIQETLALLAGCFKDLDIASLTQMEALISQNIEKVDPAARLLAVRYAVAIFAPDHIPSRYVLLLACGDQKEEIAVEASKALKQVLTQDTSVAKGSHCEDGSLDCVKRLKIHGPALPSFISMVQYIQNKAEQAIKGPRRFVLGNITLAFNPGTYIEMLMYLRICLAHSSGVLPDISSTTAMQLQAPTIGRYVRKLIGETGNQIGPVIVYIEMARQLITALNGSPAMYCLLEIIAVAAEHLATHFTANLQWVKGYMSSSKDDMSQFAAELYAIVAVSTCDSPVQLSSRITELTADSRNQSVEIQRGAVLCLGFLISRLLAKLIDAQGVQQASLVSNVMEVTESKSQSGLMEVEANSSTECMDTSYIDSMDECLRIAVTNAVKQIVSQLDNVQTCTAALIAIGEIGRIGHLPLEESSMLSLVEKLIGKVQSIKDSGKVRERAAMCAGYLCVGAANFPHRTKIMNGLMEAAAAKQHELHCTIGDSLVCVALGCSSAVGRDLWTTSEAEFEPRHKNGVSELKSLLLLLLGNYVRHANPHIRQAACVWLLAVVSKCGNCPEVQSRIMHIQDAFIALLSDGDDITQDVASKGLGAVYEICGEQEKQKLVSALVETLMTGKRRKVEVQDDTALFPEGALGKTPEGQNMSTYKELCSIANDLNQPDLIYKFLHLANHQATWNTKKGAAVGFSTIATQAGEQLAPYLDKILPKLYRYQFDPSPRIQLAMTSIWNSLVTDNQKTVSKYMKQILDDLVINLTNNQWRIRESSCLALNDLLRGRPLDDIVDDLPVVWETCFRVRDDIKESVRLAADTALKTLSRASIKICDPNYGKVGSHATGIVLSCLLKSGMTSQVAEVRAISLSTIMKISKCAGSLLKPHIPLLVIPLLESITTLEPQVLNYLSLHSASSQQAQDKLDAARLAAFKATPMMEVVNLCVQYVDDSTLPELVTRLTDLIRSSVGLGTKAGSASFIISLVRQCPRDLAPYSGKLLGSLLNGMNDRNAAVRKCYASAIGNLVKVAKDASVEKVIQRVKQWYLEKEDESVHQSCEAVIHAINEQSPDILKAHATLALPLVFIAMHEVKADDANAAASSSSLWREVWNEATPGTEAGLRLYITEIVDLSQTMLASPSWSTKAQAAAAMETIADKLKSNLGAPHLGVLVQSLVTALPGRTWTGKESLLKALSTIGVACKDELLVLRDGQPSVEDISTAVIKECRRENVKYKIEALRCLGCLVQTYELDVFSELSQIVLPMLEPDWMNKANADDMNRETKQLLTECIYECIGKCWPCNAATQYATQNAVSDVLLRQLTSGSQWKVQLATLISSRHFITRLCILQNCDNVDTHIQFSQQFFGNFIPALCQSLGNAKYGNIRSESLSVIEVLVQRLRDCDRTNVVEPSTWKLLQTAVSNMSDSDSQHELQDRASRLLRSLQSVTT